MRFGVVTFPGTCDDEDARLACAKVGDVEALWHAERDLRGVDAVVVPGGFSYGDYLRAGAIARFAPVMEALAAFAREGGPVLGICNGFQVLCEAGLLPGALLPNAARRFRCAQTELRVVRRDTPFTNACPEVLSVPAKHQSGRFFHPEPEALEAAGQVLFRYAPGENHNGSVADIAGVCNEAGNVCGLMPHPEHAVDALVGGSEDGLRIFESMARAPVGR